jgi:hypothetical protein
VLLALHPIRIKNFAALAIGTTFVNTGGRWWLHLPSDDTKSHGVDQRQVPEFVTDLVECYINVHRPILCQRNAEQSSRRISAAPAAACSSAAPRRSSSHAARTATDRNSSSTFRALSSLPSRVTSSARRLLCRPDNGRLAAQNRQPDRKMPPAVPQPRQSACESLCRKFNAIGGRNGSDSKLESHGVSIWPMFSSSPSVARPPAVGGRRSGAH